MNRVLFTILLLFSFCLGEQEVRKIYINDDFKSIVKKNGIFKIAILPMQNMSMYPNIAYYFREHLKELIAFKGYLVVSTKLIDKSLKELGVQKADHLRLLNFNKLSKITSADAILSGIVETATIQDAAIYSGFSFTASLKLQLRNGEVLWYNLSNRVAKRRLAFDPLTIALDFISNRQNDKHFGNHQVILK